MPILVVVLYQSPDKPGFLEYPKNSLKESNICNIQEGYLLDGFNNDNNNNLLSRN